jgi:NADH dehydrogenase
LRHLFDRRVELQASPLAKMLADKTGAETDRAGRIPVNGDCTLPGHPEVFALGDMVSLNKLPGVAQPALQEGRYVGKVIKKRLAGSEDITPFKYFDKGTMATIGRGAAVVQFHRGRTLKGKTAALAWGTVHLALLSTGEDRAKAMVEWSWAGFTHERSGRITVRTEDED